METQNKTIKESYKDYIQQGFKKVTFKDYKKKYLEMDKEIKTLNQEKENLKKISDFLKECGF